MKCEAHDNSLYQSGETLKYTRESSTQPLQSSMDVVFVVEERYCNRDVANKLKDIVYEMEKSLTRAGGYHIHHKYWNTLFPFQICPKLLLNKFIILCVDVS